MRKNEIMTDIEAWNFIANIDYKIHHTYGQTYLESEQASLFSDCISALRRNRNTDSHDINVLKQLLQSLIRHRMELNEFLRNQPRRDAQAFIGKKNVREFIFKRDGNKCLRCFREDRRLSLDHIVPVNKNGENKISNLQTLCVNCNSWKSDKIIDYR